MKRRAILIVAAAVLIILTLPGCNDLDSKAQLAAGETSTSTTPLISISPQPASTTETTKTSKPSLSLTPTAIQQQTLAIDSNPEQYCAELTNHNPQAGKSIYCDTHYGFAFEYPADWEREELDRNDPQTHPIAYEKATLFLARDNDNSLRLYTWKLPAGNTLRQAVEAYPGYQNREYKRDYQPMRLLGKPAYGFVNRATQDYNSLTIFFEHGAYYSVMHFSLPTRQALDDYWPLIQSLQTQDGPPEENILPEELFQDSNDLTQ